MDELHEPYTDRANRQHAARQNFLRGLGDAYHRWHERDNRLLVTSRPFGLTQAQKRGLGFDGVELLPLRESLRPTFIRRWFHASAADQTGAEALIDHLVARRDDRDLQEMCASPILLSAICFVSRRNDGRVPDNPTALYRDLVDQVLANRYVEGGIREKMRRRLELIALGMHTGEPHRQARYDPALEVELEEVCEILEAHRVEADEAIDTREELLNRSGLLLHKGHDRVVYFHRTLQEYLVAQALHRDRTPLAEVLARHGGSLEWRVTVTFLFSAALARDPDIALAACHEVLLPAMAADPLRDNPAPALLLGECLLRAQASGAGMEAFQPQYMAGCEVALEVAFDPELRARLWELGGLLGFDRRPGVELCPDGLPDIEWCALRPGPDEPAIVLERDGGSFQPSGFLIAKYPVTVAQFQAFLDDPQGYRQAHWWHPRWLEAGFVNLEQPPASYWSAPNGPREEVSWFEAMAFCAWLTARMQGRPILEGGRVIRLPTEWEWQQAARRRIDRSPGAHPPATEPAQSLEPLANPQWHNWPWAGAVTEDGEHWDPRLANTRDSAPGRTTAVGLYPGGASPAGALDMAGNVWEWCLNTDDEPHGLTIDSTDAWRVVRGGAWNLNRAYARVAYRRRYLPVLRNDLVGFRLCVSSHIALHPAPRLVRGEAGIVRRLRLADRGGAGAMARAGPVRTLWRRAKMPPDHPPGLNAPGWSPLRSPA